MSTILENIFDYKKNLSLVGLLFFSGVVIFSFTSNIAFGSGVSEGCGYWDLREGCDLSGWMHLVLDSAQAGALAIFLHFLAHRQTKKLELIITNQENKRIRKENFAKESLKNHFTVLLFSLSILNRMIKKSNETQENCEKINLEIKENLHKLENTALTIQYTSLTSSDVIAPEALTEIQQILRLIQNAVKFNDDVYTFRKYDEIKEKVTNASSLM